MRILAAFVIALSVAGASRAQDSAEDAKKAAVLDEARQHVAKAKVHYDLGEYKDAADEYILVYRLRPIPAILFNVAQAYRQGGMYEKARQFYKSYLRESPDAKNKTMIEQAIKEMDDLLAKDRRTKEAAPTGVKEPAETSLPIMAAPKPAPAAAKPVEPPPMPAAIAAKPVEPPPMPAAIAAKPAAPEPQPVAAKPAPEVVKAPESAKPPEAAKAPPQTVAAKPAPQTVAMAPAKPAVTVAPQPPVAKPAVAAAPRPSAPPAATTATPAPASAPVAEEDGSIFTKWWLWTAVGVVAVGAGAAAMTMGGNAPPTSHLGTNPVFP